MSHEAANPHDVDCLRMMLGVVEFVWRGAGAEPTLLNVCSDPGEDTHTVEVAAVLTDTLPRHPAAGDRVEIAYEPIPHEIVDPGTGATAEGHRLAVRRIAIIG